jgi:hypothetical protein
MRRWNLMLRFTGVMKLSHRVRSSVDLFASNHTAQYHCEKGEPDHDTTNFKHANASPSDAFVIGRRIAGEVQGTLGTFRCANFFFS